MFESSGCSGLLSEWRTREKIWRSGSVGQGYGNYGGRLVECLSYSDN